MIRILIALSNRFKFVDSFLTRLTFAYAQNMSGDQLKRDAIKKLAEKVAMSDLKRVNAWEKNGALSGYNPPIINRPGRN